MNVLARLPFRCREELILTTTLQPCLQCAAAIRLGPIGAHLGEGPVVDLVHELEGSGEAQRLAAMKVDEALGYLWPRLETLTGLTFDIHPPEMS